MSKSRPFEDFIGQVKKGREGGNEWLPVGMKSLNKHIGLGQKKYYLIGGESGTGKTSLTDSMFILQPCEWYLANQDKIDKKLRIIYRSMERPNEEKIAKWACRRLWIKHKILADPKTILGWGYDSPPVPEEVDEKIYQTREYFDRILDIVELKGGAENPTGMYKECRKISLSEGIEFKSDDEVIKYYDKDHFSEGKICKKFSGDYYDETRAGKRYFEVLNVHGEEYKVYKYDRIYIPKDKDIINVIVADHMLKFKSERGYSQKQTIDKATEYFGDLRDVYGWSPVAVSQFNRNISQVARRTKLDLTPEKQDFKGSGDMYQDADFVLALFSPHENGITTFKKYQISKFKNKNGFNRFRSLHILKNSYGIDMLVKAMSFMGEFGHFYELPSPSNLSIEDMMYYADPEKHPEHKNQVIDLTV